jgi:hypothetical protein
VVTDEETPEQLEREIEDLEERVHIVLQGDAARRVRHLRRQAAEATPDALFSGDGEGGLRGLARRTDSYGFVLLLLAALIWIFVPFASAERWATGPTAVVFFVVVLISMHTSMVRERWFVGVAVIDTMLFILAIIGGLTDNDDIRSAANAGFGVLLILTGLVVLRRVLSHQVVTTRTLSGAVSSFLLLGLAFACFAEAIVLQNPDAFATNNGDTTFGAMLYYSFVTQATLGYGDIVPLTSLARSLATMQAIAGQIYLVTIVARLVSLLGMRRITTASPPSSSDAGGQSQ